MRPLTAAVAAAGRGRFVLDGVARMRERPIQARKPAALRCAAAVLCVFVLDSVARMRERRIQAEAAPRIATVLCAFGWCCPPTQHWRNPHPSHPPPYTGTGWCQGLLHSTLLHPPTHPPTPLTFLCCSTLHPLQDLVDGLVQLGVKASCTMGTGCPPVEIFAEGLPSGKVRPCGDSTNTSFLQFF